MPEAPGCSVEASKEALDSPFQSLGPKSHFWGVCRFSFERIPPIPLVSAELAALPERLSPPPRVPPAGGLSCWLGRLCPSRPRRSRSPALSSPVDVGRLHVAQAAGLRAAQQEHVGLEGQRGGESTWLSPSSPELPPSTAPACASSGASLTGTKLSLRRRTMSPTQMSRHFCQRKLQENEGGGEFSSSRSSGNGGWGCSRPPDQPVAVPASCVSGVTTVVVASRLPG